MRGKPQCTSITIVLILSVVFVALAGFCIAWVWRPLVPKRYAEKQIRLASGQTLYVKRQASTMNHDHLSLSLNGDRCKDEDWKTDFRFQSVDAPDGPVYYVPGDNTLTVFAGLDEPSGLKWPFQIRQQLPALKMMEHLPDEVGLSKVEIGVSDLSPCP